MFLITYHARRINFVVKRPGDAAVRRWQFYDPRIVDGNILPSASFSARLLRKLRIAFALLVDPSARDDNKRTTGMIPPGVLKVIISRGSGGRGYSAMNCQALPESPALCLSRLLFP